MLNIIEVKTSNLLIEGTVIYITKIKTEYAANNKIKLLRISYIERNNLSNILKNNIIIT